VTAYSGHEDAQRRRLLSVLGQFSLRLLQADEPGDGPDLEVPVSQTGRRLLALLALQPRPVSREWLTGRLWPDADDQHAAWRIRAALTRLPQPEGRRLVTQTDDLVGLSRDVSVDVQEHRARALAMVGEAAEIESVGWRDVAALQEDVLPGWDDDWVVLERERHRQLRLHALESLAVVLTGQRRFALALQCALAAVDGEPLRESAHRRVIEVHLAEGNVGEAIRQFRRCRQQLADDLGIRPSRSLTELVAGAQRAGRPT
jgi:DNA-binding SARP family transcriptional activator